MSDDLWDRHQVAEFLGLSPGSAKAWLWRNSVPVAGHGPPDRGRVANLYRPADVRAAQAAAPGKGNRTPRKARR